MLKPKFDNLKIGKNLSSFFPGIIVFFIIVSGLFFIRQRINEILLLKKNLKQEEKKLAQLTTKVADLEGLDEVELGRKADKAIKAVPSEKNVPMILSVIKTVASGNNIELSSLQVNPGELTEESAKGGLSHLLFKINAIGPIENLNQFLFQITQTIPLMELDEIRLEGKELEGSFQAKLSLNSLFMPLPKTLGDLEKPMPKITREEQLVWQELANLDFSLAEKEPVLVPVGKDNPFIF